MRVSQAYISSSVLSFKEQLFDKYHLTEYTDRSKPVVIFGMYTAQDLQTYLFHQGRVIVVWCGSDGMKLSHGNAELIKSRKAVHYTMGQFVGDDLKRFGIKHTVSAITPTRVNLSPVPRGNKIYAYGMDEPEFYNIELVKRIGQRLHLEVVLTGHNTYSFDQLVRVYAECFIGLRLTPHDGLACSVLELGLMGRRSVFNGGAPYSIPWTNEEDVYHAVLKEYRDRKKDNRYISRAFKKYINDDDLWLHV